MKKFSIVKQLIVLFSLVFLLAIILFAMFVNRNLERSYERESFSRLNIYVLTTESYWKNGEPVSVIVDKADYPFSYYQGNANDNYKISYSDNSSKIATPEDVYYVISQMKEQNKQHGIYENVFYSYEKSDNGNYIIFFTNTDYIEHLKDCITKQLIFIFVIITVFALIVILIWSKFISNRLFKLNNFIEKLSERDYRDKCEDGYPDEIGMLSKEIDKVRQKIKYNENVKQDMLQNISHDFKTPIAVINNYAEAIQDGMAEPKEAATILLSQTQTLRKKVNTLLQYNRLEYLEHDKDFEKVSMKQVVESVLNIYKYQNKPKITAKFKNEVIYYGYFENFYTVVSNIVDNANRYAKDNIIITLYDNQVEIYNDGPQIDEQFLNSNFRAYEKGFNGQFGLGMSIVVKTLKFFNMKLEVKNREVGVSFIISNID